MSDDVRGDKRRGVSFNLSDEEERDLYQWSFNLNFSGFVKECLRKERQRQKVGQSSMKVRME